MIKIETRHLPEHELDQLGWKFVMGRSNAGFYKKGDEYYYPIKTDKGVVVSGDDRSELAEFMMGLDNVWCDITEGDEWEGCMKYVKRYQRTKKLDRVLGS